MKIQNNIYKYHIYFRSMNIIKTYLSRKTCVDRKLNFLSTLGIENLFKIFALSINFPQFSYWYFRIWIAIMFYLCTYITLFIDFITNFNVLWKLMEYVNKRPLFTKVLFTLLIFKYSENYHLKFEHFDERKKLNIKDFLIMIINTVLFKLLFSV